MGLVEILENFSPLSCEDEWSDAENRVLLRKKLCRGLQIWRFGFQIFKTSVDFEIAVKTFTAEVGGVATEKQNKTKNRVITQKKKKRAYVYSGIFGWCRHDLILNSAHIFYYENIPIKVNFSE